MREGPLGLGLQDQGSKPPQSCSGSMAGVVSVAGKGGITRQVCAGKTNASEPLMMCRKRRDVAETRLQTLVWDEARRVPADWPSGDRHEDGRETSERLLCGTWGTWSSDAQGRPPSGRPVRSRVPKRSTGADGSVLVMKPGNAGGAKGPGFPAEERRGARAAISPIAR